MLVHYNALLSSVPLLSAGIGLIRRKQCPALQAEDVFTLHLPARSTASGADCLEQATCEGAAVSQQQMVLVKDATTTSKQAAPKNSKPADYQDGKPAEQQYGSAELSELEHRHAKHQPPAVPHAEVSPPAYKQSVDHTHRVDVQQLQRRPATPCFS